MQGSFYRLRRSVRGGGEAGSKTKELAEDDMAGAGGPMRNGAENAPGLGSTKINAPVTTGSVGWQHAMVQSIAAFPSCSHTGGCAAFAAPASLELFFCPCPCS